MTDSRDLLSFPASDPALWPLDPQVTFLNHGSFGSCPNPVLALQQQWRERLERQPVRFFVRELEGLLDEARQCLAHFLGAEAEDLVWVPNATAGVNAVLRSLRFQAGEELLVTNHEYNACRNALNYVAEQSGARVVVADVPFPVAHGDECVELLMARVTSRTRLVLVDHVTSQTGMIFPVERLTQRLSAQGVDVLIDGAHAPGMIPLNLDALGAAYYTGNCHKWLCAPKGAGFLFVRRDHQRAIRPLAISHGANSRRTDRSRFQIEFGWTGTWDPTPYLCVPESIRFLASQRPGGWPEVMERNRALALEAKRLLCGSLSISQHLPEEMIGALVSFPLPDASSSERPNSPLYGDALQDRLGEKFGIEVPIIPWPAWPKRLLRISAQLYNSLPQYQKLAEALQKVLF